MARLFRSQLKPFQSSSVSRNYKDIVSPTGAYSIKSLMEMAHNNQTLPSMHTYQFSNAPKDLSLKTTVVNDITSATALAKKHADYEQQAKDLQAEKVKADELAKKEAYDNEVIRKFKEENNIQ